MKLDFKKTKEKIKNTSKTSIVLTILVFIILITMGTGYAVLNQDVFIKGKSQIKQAEYKIYVSNIKMISSSEAYETVKPTMSDNEVGVYTTLSNGNASITYELTIKNTGESDAVVDHIYVSNNNTNVKYKIVGTHATETIPHQSVKTVKVIIEAAENATISNTSSDILINFDFIRKQGDYSNDCTLNWDGATSTTPVMTNILGTDYYQIANANELKWFADQINNGNTSINAMLTNDICLSNKYLSIGTSNAYTGIFDGQNRSIKDVNYERNINVEDDVNYSAALFINNSGTIKNLNVEGSVSDIHTITGAENTSRLGGIVLENNGVIENSSYKGKITLNTTARVNCLVKQAHTYNYIGGITSNNKGVIRGCYNNAIFDIKGSTAYGGCNLYSRSTNIWAGGIAGENTGYVVDSYNNANISATGSTQSIERATYNGYIGGIAGTNTSTCKYGYNTGNVTQTISGNGGSSQTGVIATNTGNVNNIYFLTGSVNNNNTATEVNATDLINLNINIGNAFLKDTKSINNGYPILFWE